MDDDTDIIADENPVTVTEFHLGGTAKGDICGVEQAAAALRKSPKTVRKWIQEGAPCVRPGSRGRGNGALVSKSDLAAWRARRAGVDDGTRRVLEKIASSLLNTQTRDAGAGRPAYTAIGISRRESAGLLLMAFSRIHLDLTGRDPGEDGPDAIKQLWRFL